MTILLVGPDDEENLSIRYLSASLLNGGHDTVLAAFNSPVDADAVVHAAPGADLVGLSMCFQARAGEFLDLARRIKMRDPKKVVVAGGHYASCAAEPLLANHPEIDIVVIHEGERALVEMAAGKRIEDIAGVAYRDGGHVHFTKPRPALADLDELPFPDRRGPVHYIAGVPTSYLMGSRGCYENCAYCCITTLHRMAPGKRFRQRAVERVADEMAALYHERGTRQFVFHDDNFLVPSEAMNHARISALEKALESLGVEEIVLVIKCRPADADREVLRRLRRLGLVRVFLGVESATERGLAALERKQSVADSERALETCAELGISAQFTLMIFNPDTTLETLRADVAFMRRFSGNPLNFCRAEIYAGTPLEQRMIQCGRAMGDYLARTYRMADPATDLACRTALELFYLRCWSGGSLMQHAIGLDHTATVVKRFYKGSRREALARRVADWVRAVNLDTLELLREVTDGAERREAPRDIFEREVRTRAGFFAESAKLRAELAALRFEGRNRLFEWPRLGKQAAAAVLAIGIPTTTAQYGAMAQQGATAAATCTLSGKVTDPSGAIIPQARVTITNVDTKEVRTVTSGELGEYWASGLAAGQYTVKVEMMLLGFRTIERSGIVLKAGASERIDLRMAMPMGVSEYAAAPLAIAEDYVAKKKPFPYMVGEAKDHGTLQGVAALVYGDKTKWVQIFEANREALDKPGPLFGGTQLTIPPEKRVIPKLIAKAAPVYPAEAKSKSVWGDVVLDVTLRSDGTVEETRLIDGNSLLVEAATSAVKQWRYRPLTVKGRPVLKLVVVVSFEKNGKVRWSE